MTDALTYKIDTFEGPLDLLLSLIAKNKMDIRNIQIAVIFTQYMEYLDRMQKMDMEIAGEFIVMASELMLIKSRMLLPKTEEAAEDPRERLALALLEYQRAKEAAAYLEEQYALHASRYAKDTDEISVGRNEIAAQDVRLLQKALLRLFSKKDRDAVPPFTNIHPILAKEIVPVSAKIRSVTEQLEREGCISFLHLFDAAASKSEVVAIFMAVLALVKDGHVTLEKRLELQNDADEDGVGAYAYTFYCALNPENVLPEEYAEIYDKETQPVKFGETGED